MTTLQRMVAMATMSLVCVGLLVGCGENESPDRAADSTGPSSAPARTSPTVQAARPAAGPRAVPQKGTPSTPESSVTPGAANAQLRYLCTQGEIDEPLCVASGFPSSSTTPDGSASAHDPGLRDLCARGQAADALCAAAGHSMPVASIGSGPADTQLATLCAREQADPKLCRTAGH